MLTHLEVLIVEDSSSATDWIVSELRRTGFDVSWNLASNEFEYIAALSDRVDIILCNYAIPGFGAHRAHRILTQRGLDIPFIVLTDSMDDHAQAESMRSGAIDYIFKDRPGRLSQAVTLAKYQRQLRVDRRQLEQAALDLNTTFNAVLESSPVAVIPLDRDGNTIVWNEAAEKIFELSSDEALGKVINFGSHCEQARYVEYSASVLAGETLTNVSISVHRRDGAVKALNFSAAPLYDLDGQVTGSVEIFADVTERKRLQAELLEAQKLDSLGRLTGGIAHDFNNMLTAIMGFSELVTLRGTLDSLSQGYVEHIAAAARKAHELSQQLLAFMRQRQIEPTSVDINDVLVGVKMILTRLIGENIELKFAPQAGLHNILVDRGQFEQILVNLVINARDAIDGAGVITITTENVTLDADFDSRRDDTCAAECVLLSVEDDGAGMDDVTQARAFEPFFTTKEAGKGTGLGLASANGIVKLAGGHISLQSSLGKGTSVHVYIPATAAPTDILGVTDTTPLDAGTETILVAEDEPAVRALAVCTLRGLGYNVLEAANGRDAILAARGHEMEIALLVTDARMPLIGGDELTQHLIDINPSLRVLCASGYPAKPVRPNHTRTRVHYMAKPYLPTALAHKVREILDLPSIGYAPFDIEKDLPATPSN